MPEKQKRIVILGTGNDPHCVAVGDELQKRKAVVYILDASRFPHQVRLSFDPLTGSGITSLDGGSFDWKDIHSVYWRTFTELASQLSTRLPNTEQQVIAYHDSRSLFESVLIASGCRWINGWEGYQLHQRKPLALARVADLGVRIPATLYSNDRQRVENFFRLYRQVIFKPVQGGAYTKALGEGELTEVRLASLDSSPVTLQEQIKGKNLRVYVIGNKVMACEILTSELDFREDSSATMREVSVSASLRKLCLKIAKRLHLKWSGMDFIASDKEIYFLEANPSPMFLGFQKRTGLPILQGLCDLLLASG